MTMNEAAWEVLSDYGEPLHLRDLCKKIEERGLYQFESMSKEHSLGRAMAERCKSNGSPKDALFYRFAKATYGLIEWDKIVPPDFDFDNFIPAKELYKFIELAFPAYDNTWISSIDNSFGEGGELEVVFRKSVLFYVCRRLVQKAKLITTDVGSISGVFDRSTALELLREGLNQYSFKGIDIEQLAWLLRECIRESKHNIPTHTLQLFLKRAEQKNENCYICGRELDYYNKNLGESAEVEHIWPKSMGGSNTLNNLNVSCRKCNKAKEDVWGSEDFHFERLCYLKVKKSFKYEHRLSILLRDSCQCSLCGKKAPDVGSLFVQRKNQDDIWHYTNLMSVCLDHVEDINECV